MSVHIVCTYVHKCNMSMYEVRACVCVRRDMVSITLGFINSEELFF
jgi:hypothetical protein